jgi:ubiquinone/menaquinone biosynthesis C-methylase UbiE
VIKKERLYNDLAWIWPVMSPPEEYVEEAEFLTEIIKSYISYPPKTMLHLGCGGGHIDMTLKRHFRITGIDMSDNMLDLAKKLNPEVRYVKGDMRNIRLDEKFDVVLLYDGINYMTTEFDLKAAFETAYYNLQEDGIALTVVEETPSAFKQNKTKVQHRKDDNIELTYVAHWYDPDPGDTTYETTFLYLIRKNKEFAVEVDMHICGIFEVEVWEKLLKEAGFTPKQDTFRHSTFSPGEEYPILIGFKGKI